MTFTLISICSLVFDFSAVEFWRFAFHASSIKVEFISLVIMITRKHRDEAVYTNFNLETNIKQNIASKSPEIELETIKCDNITERTAEIDNNIKRLNQITMKYNHAPARKPPPLWMRTDRCPVHKHRHLNEVKVNIKTTLHSKVPVMAIGSTYQGTSQPATIASPSLSSSATDICPADQPNSIIQQQQSTHTYEWAIYRIKKLYHIYKHNKLLKNLCITLKSNLFFLLCIRIQHKRRAVAIIYHTCISLQGDLRFRVREYYKHLLLCQKVIRAFIYCTRARKILIHIKWHILEHDSRHNYDRKIIQKILTIKESINTQIRRGQHIDARGKLTLLQTKGSELWVVMDRLQLLRLRHLQPAHPITHHKHHRAPPAQTHPTLALVRKGRQAHWQHNYFPTLYGAAPLESLSEETVREAVHGQLLARRKMWVQERDKRAEALRLMSIDRYISCILLTINTLL